MLGTPERLLIDVKRIKDALRLDEEVTARLRQAHLESVPAILKNLILDEDDVRRFAGASPLATENSSPLAFAEGKAFGKRWIPLNASALSQAVGDGFPKIIGATDDERERIAAVIRIRRPYLETVRCWDERNHVEGLKHLEEALAAGWEDADLAWYLRWMTILASKRHQRDGNLEKAVTDFRRWAEVFPRSPWTRISLGHFLVDKGISDEKTGLVEEGVEELRKGVELAPGDPIVLYEVSQAFLAIGKDEEAIPVLEKYVEVVPDDATNWRNLVGAYLRSKEYAEAVPLMRKLAERYPDDPLSWSTLAGAYIELEQYAEAKAALLKALRLDPVNPAFRLELRRLDELLESGNLPPGKESPSERPSPETPPR